MKKTTPEDFWTHPYTRGLSPFGKLAFSYARSAEMQGVAIVLEDMATFTGLEVTACGDWIDIFVNAGMLERETVLDAVL